MLEFVNAIVLPYHTSISEQRHIPIYECGNCGIV